MAHLYDLLEEDCTITSSTKCVDYNKDDGAMTSLLVFEPQDFVRSPSNKIAIFDTDDK